MSTQQHAGFRAGGVQFNPQKLYDLWLGESDRCYRDYKLLNEGTKCAIIPKERAVELAARMGALAGTAATYDKVAETIALIAERSGIQITRRKSLWEQHQEAAA